MAKYEIEVKVSVVITVEADLPIDALKKGQVEANRILVEQTLPEGTSFKIPSPHESIRSEPDVILHNTRG